MLPGCIVALITPFDEFGEVDYQSLEELIEWHIEEGTEGLVLCGSTGEGSSLSLEERCDIFRTSVDVAKGRISLIAGTGSNQTKESIFLTEEAQKMGVDGCLTIVPYYSRPTEEGCFQHFYEISQVGLPMIVYHHPGRTGVKLSADALTRICEINEVIGIKDASGDLNLAMEIIRKTDTPLFSGDDSLSLAYFSIGFMGSISIVANIIPKKWRRFVDLVCEGDFTSARRTFYDLYPLCEAMVLETNPQCVKYAVSLLGKCHPMMRLPLIEPREETQKRIRGCFQKEGLNNYLV